MEESIHFFFNAILDWNAVLCKLIYFFLLIPSIRADFAGCCMDQVNKYAI